MKIVCISDTHTQHSKLQLPEGDILIHSGDLTYRGTFAEWVHSLQWLNIQSKLFKHVIFIAGNHDFNTEHYIGKGEQFPTNMHYLEDSGIEIEGIKFWGSPRTPKFHNWAFMDYDFDLKQYWDKIPDDTEILITHGPVHSILDKNKEGLNCGSKSLYDRLKQLKCLRKHICGHIHEAYGREIIDDIEFINCSVLNRLYEIANKPIIIEV